MAREKVQHLRTVARGMRDRPDYARGVRAAFAAVRSNRPTVGNDEGVYETVTPAYCAGLRDALRRCFEEGIAKDWDARECAQRLADRLGVPYLFVALLDQERMSSPTVTAQDIDDLEGWLCNSDVELLRGFSIEEES